MKLALRAVLAAALFSGAAAAHAAGKTHAVRIEGMKFVPERQLVACKPGEMSYILPPAPRDARGVVVK